MRISGRQPLPVLFMMLLSSCMFEDETRTGPRPGRPSEVDNFRADKTKMLLMQAVELRSDKDPWTLVVSSDGVADLLISTEGDDVAYSFNISDSDLLSLRTHVLTYRNQLKDGPRTSSIPPGPPTENARLLAMRVDDEVYVTCIPPIEPDRDTLHFSIYSIWKIGIKLLSGFPESDRLAMNL